MGVIKIGERMVPLSVDANQWVLRSAYAAVKEERDRVVIRFKRVPATHHSEEMLALQADLCRLNAVAEILASVINIRKAIRHLPKEEVVTDLTRPLMAVVIDNLQKRNL